jgi:hypothetical protein
MERLNITRPARVGVGLSIAIACGAVALSVGLMRVTAADRLVDGGYDQVIALTSSQREPATVMSGGVLRLATHPVRAAPSVPTAATEHAWLTRPTMQAEPGVVEPALAPAMGAVIGTSVGARFTVASADSVQTLEVVDVSDIPAEQLNRSGTAMSASTKMLLVSCRIVDEGKVPTSQPAVSADVIRFIVSAGPSLPVGLPRAL